MITFQFVVHINGIGGLSVFDFMINPNDSAYQRWWPGTHLRFHAITKRAGHVGDVIYMDEYVGKRRVQMNAVVTEVEPGRRITWQMTKGMRLPVWLHLELKDDTSGVMITHAITAGFKGIGSILDVILHLYFSASFARAMDEHARIEFPRSGGFCLGRICRRRSHWANDTRYLDLGRVPPTLLRSHTIVDFAEADAEYPDGLYGAPKLR